MPYTRAFTLLIAATLMLAAVPSLAARSQADHNALTQAPTTVVAVEPFLSTVPIGGTTEVRIGIENPANLIAFGIQLSFDPTVIQIDDDDPERPGVQVGMGSLLDGREYFPGNNTVDNAAGTVDIAITLMAATSPIQPINENGDLVTILVHGEADGASPLALSRVDLIDSQLNPLPADLVDGVIVVSSGSTATPSATAIAASATPTPTATPTSSPTVVAASATPSPTAPATSTPVPTNTPTSTLAPAPTFTHHVQLPLILRDFQISSTSN